MKIKQLSVFIENKEGRLKNALNVLSKENINIRALSVADSEKYGILHLIVNDNEKAKKALEKENLIVKETEVIVVGIPDKPNGLNHILEILEKDGINVEYIYAFVSTKADEAVVVMKIEDIEKGLKLLKEANSTILTRKDINNL
ncbi:MAG: acetolactate synthase [Methanobacteriaceae archaeon]|nr:acetolactate synthase [Methanobacteriaceae archaeon]